MSHWNKILNLARKTQGKKPIEKEPSGSFKRQILCAEHSPIRAAQISTTLTLPYYVSVHLVRHHEGILHFVRTSRPDKTGKARGSQEDLVEHTIVANFQAVINISRQRLCEKADINTRHAWQSFLTHVSEREPELARAAVPNCIYRGFCPEGKATCGYFLTKRYREHLDAYRKYFTQDQEM